MYNTPHRDHKEQNLHKNANNTKNRIKGYIAFDIWRILVGSLIAGLNWKRRPVKNTSTLKETDDSSHDSHVDNSVSQGTIRSYIHFFVR